MEGLIPQKWGESAVEIPGSRSLISSLGPLSVPWAIVTSGTKPLVTGWLERLSLPKPEHLVVAEDVEYGKPDPTCYKMGLEKLNMQMRAAEVLVLEDSPAGIKAGRMAGCKVLAVVTSHTVDQVVNAGADWVVRDLRSVRVMGKGKGGEALLEIRNALVVS
jgi:glycerol-1-phosphatase